MSAFDCKRNPLPCYGRELHTRSVGIAILCVACSGSRPPDQLSSRDVAQLSGRSGAVSAELIEDPGAPQLQLGPGEEFTAAQLMTGNRPPEYPQDLLTKNVSPHVVAVRVTFGEDGHVMTISQSPVAPSTQSADASHFMNAVREAVVSWYCSPARIRKFRGGPDSDGDGKPDYRIMTAQQILKTFFDLSFSFEVLNGHPVVKPHR